MNARTDLPPDLSAALPALDAIRALDGEMRDIRHQIHQNPELGFEEVTEQARDDGDMAVVHFLALAAQALAHLLPEAAGVNELHEALAVVGLAVAQHPHIGGDAGVVEHVGGQADDGLHEVVLQHVAADLALAAAGAAGEQR